MNGPTHACLVPTPATLTIPGPGTPEGDGHKPSSGDGRSSQGCPAEISFTSRGQHVCVEFGVSDGLAGMTVFVAPADEDATPGMGVLHLAPPPEQARAIGRMLLALADAAERGGATR